MRHNNLYLGVDAVCTDLEYVANVIQRAFAPGGPGILLISDLYEKFEHDRIKLFQGARALANLPDEQLAQLELPQVDYAFGWSRGREILGGVVEESKGGFFANPIYDHPSQGDAASDKKYKYFLHNNHWPSQPSCRTVEPYFKKIGRYINTIAIQIAHHCDRYLQSNLQSNLRNDRQLCSLEQLLRESIAAKGRLLHYFPTDPAHSSSSPNNHQKLWSGFHNDLGIITGLVSGAYYENDNDTPMPAAPDQTAGLYIVHGSNAQVQKYSFPADHLGFQIGETAQILSGGMLRATPHAVKMPADMRGISRVSFVVFLQPSPQVKVSLPGLSDTESREALRTEDCIPALSDRYQEGNTFGEFAVGTIKPSLHLDDSE